MSARPDYKPGDLVEVRNQLWPWHRRQVEAKQRLIDRAHASIDSKAPHLRVPPQWRPARVLEVMRDGLRVRYLDEHPQPHDPRRRDVAHPPWRFVRRPA